MADDAPQDVSATAGGKGITVRWSSRATDGGSSITGCRAYRRIASGVETLLATVGPGTTGDVDTSVARRTRYVYWVTAVNIVASSVPSSEVTIVSR